MQFIYMYIIYIYVYKYNLFITKTVDNTEKHEEAKTLILSR